MLSAEIRQKFIEYFCAHQHREVASSSLVPMGDDSLMFTNAGMVQFKDVFLGKERRDYQRAVTAQRCLRAGGKHNDLENVGYTARHHTFFEMLGNFSFGDYFKKEAIQLAWQFLTEVLNLPAEKLWVTVFEEDQEAEKIWLEDIKIDPSRFSRIGAKDNFWQMGDTGPCGPCSEIFYDHGEHVFGGPPGSKDEDGDRYIEIWNLVFMQYNRDSQGVLTPLPHPSVDTGMGLERLAAILQGVHSNYEIDIFQALIKAAQTAVGCQERDNSSLRVIADHIRSCAFLLADGVLPANEGRGYVLRRIIRRACRHGHKLGQQQPFFHQLVDELARQMGAAYNELNTQREFIKEELLKEEQRFLQTLNQGMQILQSAIQDLKGKVIDGEVVFQLYDTYGFPLDLTADIAREQGLELDIAGYEKCMDAQRARARAASGFQVDLSQRLEILEESDFTGYQLLDDHSSIETIVVDGQLVRAIKTGEKGSLVLANTPFYAESGGQVGDRGEIIQAQSGAIFVVEDTQKNANAILHIGTVKAGSFAVGEHVGARVNQALRHATELNHSATHLLHWALRSVLGTHVCQKGSLVNDKYLRFDFSHPEPISDEKLQQIEDLVNAEVRKNLPTDVALMDIQSAQQKGAMALFGEKYGDEVRVLSIGSESIELCGGTHVKRSGDIGMFKIIAQTGVAAGIRRIEAITGEASAQWISASETELKAIGKLVNTERGHLLEKIQQLQHKNRELEKDCQRLMAELASNQGGDLSAEAVEIGTAKLLCRQLQNVNSKVLRETLDKLKSKLGSAVVVLATVEEGKVRIVAGVSKDLIGSIKAGEVVNFVAQQVGGRGGGRPDMAEAGGSEPDKLPQALASVADFVQGKLSA